MIEIACIVMIVFGILQIVLFYKMWVMTDNVKELLLTIKSKECRELGLPRKAKLKDSGLEVRAYDVENGQILCAVNNGGYEYSEAYDYENVELL